METKEFLSISNPRNVVFIFDKDVDLINDEDLALAMLNVFAPVYRLNTYTLLPGDSVDKLSQEIAKFDKPFVVAFGNAVTPIEAALDKTNNYMRRVFIHPSINEKNVQSLMGHISDYDKENTFIIYLIEDKGMWENPKREDFNPLIKRYLKKHPKYLPRSGSVNDRNGLLAIGYYLLQWGIDPYSRDDLERIME